MNPHNVDLKGIMDENETKPKNHKYLNMKVASKGTGIPREHIKAIKDVYPDAFDKNQIHEDLLVDYYNKHKQEIIATCNKSSVVVEELKKQRLQNQVKLQELQIAETEKKLISIEDLKEFLNKLGVGVSNLLVAKLVSELPDRINRTESSKRVGLCKELYNEIVKKLQDDIDNWLNNYNEETTAN